jgi:hypothetical protein
LPLRRRQIRRFETAHSRYIKGYRQLLTREFHFAQNLPAGLEVYFFSPPQRKEIRKYPLRPLRLCGECKIQSVNSKHHSQIRASITCSIEKPSSPR